MEDAAHAPLAFAEQEQSGFVGVIVQQHNSLVGLPDERADKHMGVEQLPFEEHTLTGSFTFLEGLRHLLQLAVGLLLPDFHTFQALDDAM